MQDLSDELLMRAADAEDGMPVSAGGPPCRQLAATSDGPSRSAVRESLLSRVQWLPLAGNTAAAAVGAAVAGPIGAVVGVVASHFILGVFRPTNVNAG